MAQPESHSISGCMTDPVLHLPSVRFDHGPEIFDIPEADYRRMETGYKRLSSRALLMAGENDTVIISAPVDTEYLALLKACRSGGAAHMIPVPQSGSCLTDDVIKCKTTFNFIRSWHGRIEPYMMTRSEETLGERTGRKINRCNASAADLLNDKSFFIRMVEDLGLPSIETIVGSSDAISSRLAKHSPDPVIVRRSRSLGGAGVWAANNALQRNDLKKLIERSLHKGVYLLQPLLPAILSPNLQLYIGDENICLLGETQQILTRSLEHSGNLFDPVEDAAVRRALISQSRAIADEAALMGYRGLLGVDFVVQDNGDVFAVEINARHNTSTHALWFVNRFFNNDPFMPTEPGATAFARFGSRESRTATQWLRILGDLAFDPDSGEGILPYDTQGQNLEAVISGRDAEHRRWLMDKASMIASQSL